MRKLLVLLCLATSYFVSAQSFDGSLLPTEPPTIFPTSPEAASLGSYGLHSVGPATGKMTYSIPITTISIDGQSTPISLNYAYSGLVLDGKPSTFGLGWMFTGGGVVTREVRGLPDGTRKGYYGPDHERTLINQIVQDNGNLDNILLADIIDGFLDGTYDSEVDKYTVSAGPLNFSFKIDDHKGDPVYLSKHNHKVEITYDTAWDHNIESIKVIADDGVQYFFEAEEETVPQAFEEIPDDRDSAWQLTKVVYNNGQELLFEYTDDLFTSYDYSAIAVGFEANTDSSGLGDMPVFASPAYYDGTRPSSISRKLLSKITSPKQTITLHYTQIDGRDICNQITIKNVKDQQVLDYQFTYAGSRDNLISVTKNGELVNEFEYYGVNETNGSFIPPFLSDVSEKATNQDLWKFYNGANNTIAINIPFTQFNANNAPSFYHTRLGAMKKIVYPTGGYTDVVYEPNVVAVPYTAPAISNNEQLSLNRQIHLKLKANPSNTHRLATFTYTFPDNVVGTLNHSIIGRQRDNRIIMSITKQESCANLYADVPNPPSNTNSDDYVLYSQYLRNNTGDMPRLCPALVRDIGPDTSADIEVNLAESSGGRVIIGAGTYEFKIEVPIMYQGELEAEILVRFHDPGFNTSSPFPPYIDQQVGGIRVKKLINHTNDNTGAEDTTYFTYKGNQGFSSGVLHAIPLGSTELLNKYKYPDGNNGFILGSRINHKYTLGAFSGMNVSHTTPVYYTKVQQFKAITTELIDVPTGLVVSDQNSPYVAQNPDGSQVFTNLDHNEDVVEERTYFPFGYTETTYGLPTGTIDYSHPGLPEGRDLTGLRDRTTKNYKYVGAHQHQLTDMSQTDYSQVTFDPNQNVDPNPDHPWSFQLRRKYEIFVNFVNNTISPSPSDPADIAHIKSFYEVFFYKDFDRWYVPNKVTTTQYVQGKALTTITNSTFNDKTHLIAQETTDSEGKVSKLEYQYPYDLNTAEPAYQELVDRNQLSGPVVSKLSKDNVLLNTTKIHFSLFNTIGGSQMTRPKTAESAKEQNTLHERLVYDSYDNYGNILQYHQSLATPDQPTAGDIVVTSDNISYTSILWGYENQLPIAKIENATYAAVVAALTSNGVTLTSLQTLDGQALIDALAVLRTALPDAFITTYAYKPMVGITHMQDARGLQTTYSYDAQNRLDEVRDHEDNILSKNNYNYKQ